MPRHCCSSSGLGGSCAEPLRGVACSLLKSGLWVPSPPSHELHVFTHTLSHRGSYSPAANMPFHTPSGVRSGRREPRGAVQRHRPAVMWTPSQSPTRRLKAHRGPVLGSPQSPPPTGYLCIVHSTVIDDTCRALSLRAGVPTGRCQVEQGTPHSERRAKVLQALPSHPDRLGGKRLPHLQLGSSASLSLPTS